MADDTNDEKRNPYQQKVAVWKTARIFYRAIFSDGFFNVSLQGSMRKSFIMGYLNDRPFLSHMLIYDLYCKFYHLPNWCLEQMNECIEIRLFVAINEGFWE
jgi:hypothetical protein